jgi:L-ascorbate metabolism protein UlaG (beta-lactamase superfamily)
MQHYDHVLPHSQNGRAASKHTIDGDDLLCARQALSWGVAKRALEDILVRHVLEGAVGLAHLGQGEGRWRRLFAARREGEMKGVMKMNVSIKNKQDHSCKKAKRA